MRALAFREQRHSQVSGEAGKLRRVVVGEEDASLNPKGASEAREGGKDLVTHWTGCPGGGLTWHFVCPPHLISQSTHPPEPSSGIDSLEPPAPSSRHSSLRFPPLPSYRTEYPKPAPIPPPNSTHHFPGPSVSSNQDVTISSCHAVPALAESHPRKPADSGPLCLWLSSRPTTLSPLTISKHPQHPAHDRGRAMMSHHSPGFPWPRDTGRKEGQ